MKKIIFILSMFCLAFVACESMEDTYSEYNSPKDRYPGKSIDLDVQQGWYRLKLNWENAVDTYRENVIVRWTGEDYRTDSVLLAPDTTSYEIKFELGDSRANQNFTISVAALDQSGVETKPSLDYATPFTEMSEVYDNLKSVDRKYFFLGDRLHIFLHEGLNSTHMTNITYFSGGVEVTDTITPEQFKEGEISFTAVDTDKDVSIKSTVKIPAFIDTIFYEPYVLDRERIVLSGSFRSNLMYQLGVDDITKEMLDTITTLSVDYNIETLEDVLYMPSLTNIVLGKGRMFPDTGTGVPNPEDYLSVLTEKETSVWAIKQLGLYKKAEVQDFKVHVYLNQFDIYNAIKSSPNALSYSQRKAYSENLPPAPPSYLLGSWFRPSQWENEGWTFSIENDDYYRTNPEGERSYYYGYPLENIFLLSTQSPLNWSSIQLPTTLETHDIIIDMQSGKDVKGFRFDQTNDKAILNFAQGFIRVFLATEAAPDTWIQAFYNPITQIGTGLQETTINYMDAPVNARYIKLQIKDVVSSTNNAVVFDNFYPLFD